MDALVDGVGYLSGKGGTEFSGMKRNSLRKSRSTFPMGRMSNTISRYSSTLRKIAKTNHLVHNRYSLVL